MFSFNSFNILRRTESAASRKPAANKSIANSGADVYQFSFLLLSSSSVFQSGFGSGRTFSNAPPNAKPCSLGTIVRQHS